MYRIISNTSPMIGNRKYGKNGKDFCKKGWWVILSEQSRRLR